VNKYIKLVLCATVLVQILVSELVLNDSANVGSAHCRGEGAFSYMIISVFIRVFSLGCFLKGTVCIMCVCVFEDSLYSAS
jgi:hypothetical protein